MRTGLITCFPGGRFPVRDGRFFAAAFRQHERLVGAVTSSVTDSVARPVAGFGGRQSSVDVRWRRSSPGADESRGGAVSWSLALLQVLLRCRSLMELRLEQFVGLLSERPLNELAGLAAVAAHEALRLDTSLAIRCHDDFDGLAQLVPPT
eukprot:TRINITY_DN1576_c0_g1_i9.p1 TRINITY_DN1576_c0_g1~~TRINITY_DN1576_c0_g1_i9.p1  ORF type:complete len:150 (+),score=13.83 TRINITY_DN1576_c0_g1_i9:203-652(+)